MKNKRLANSKGFTVVEMVAVIAIIAILVSLLIPALNMVREMADNVRQRAQFSSIESALEGYRADFGDYPQSYENRYACGSVADTYCGAQKLAEAMVGWDAFGFHPDSVYSRHNTSDQCDDTAPMVYSPDPCNLKERKGLYLELETANAVKLQNLYAISGELVTDSTLKADTYILADTFGKVKNLVTQKQTGMPILYYKADTSKFNHDAATLDLNIYDVRDNERVISAPVPFDNSLSHYPIANFYGQTLNPNFTSPARPYRAETFILQSAGPDGLYGNGDDVFNFDSAK